MTSSFDTSVYISDQIGNARLSEAADKLRESSSTIKLPILLLALRKMVEQGRQLDDGLARLPHHNTQGSGVLNWTAASRFNFKDLIYTTIVYSDCLATNMLLDYIGGQAEVNSWLRANGLATRLHMPYLYFSGEDGPLPRVGTTNAQEMTMIFQLLDAEELPLSIKVLVNQALQSINESWLELSLPEPIQGLRHKTGSMINCGPNGDTIYNAAGTFHKGSNKYYFCLLSRGQLNKADPVTDSEHLRRQVAAKLHLAIKNL